MCIISIVDIDCKIGATCLMGWCDHKNCKDDVECPKGSSCVNNICRAVTCRSVSIKFHIKFQYKY